MFRVQLYDIVVGLDCRVDRPLCAGRPGMPFGGKYKYCTYIYDSDVTSLCCKLIFAEIMKWCMLGENHVGLSALLGLAGQIYLSQG